MKKKDKQSRLVIPKDIWDVTCLSNDDILAFFLTNDGKIALTTLDTGYRLRYELIGKCNTDTKHRIRVSKNIDKYLGEGDFYYFTTPIMPAVIHIYKTSKERLAKLKETHLSNIY